MLKLHSLEISGFKSFLDPVEVRFADGITAIVGPNGCGKSNLTDAINWVLGEQSAKSLRGATMQDVIFNGSDKRKPVGMAEVSLVFRCDPGFPRSENGELKIGRQVFRTGESRYRINDKVVRLKEIKDLLMDTGLGTRAYSVIEQGKIGMILSNKPAERRKLLEEAAGITRYKARKRVAEVKLEETLANLLRLDDIISEVERSLRSLKRQASAARRYKAKEAEYRDLLRTTLLGRWVLQKRRLDGLGGNVEGLENREAELTAALGRDEAALAAGREELDKLSLVLAERHQAVAELAATLEGRQEFLKGARERSREMKERLEQGHEQAKERRDRIEELKRSLDGLDERSKQAIEERDEAARLVEEDEKRIASAQAEVQAAEARLEGLRGELMGSVAKVNQARSSLQQANVEIERSAYRLRYLDEERERLDQQLAESRGSLDAMRSELSETEAEVETLGERRSQLDAALEGVLRREAELSEERRELETHLAGLRQRQKILVQLSREHEERRRALREALDEIGLDSPRFLADVLEPAEGWAETIDHFLGELADAVLLDDDLLTTARALSAQGTSGLFVRPLEAGGDLPEVEDEALVYSLAEALDLPEALARALPPAFLVERAEDAERLAAEHPGIAFLSRDRVWARGGALRVQTPEAAPGVLARESELQEIAEEIPATETRIENARTTLRSLVEERTRLASEIQSIDDKTADRKRRIAVSQARQQDLEGRQKKVAAEHGGVAEEQGELRANLEQQKAKRAEAEKLLETAEKRHGELTESFDRAQAEVEAARQRREALRTEGAGRRGRLDLLEERLESQGLEGRRVRGQIEETEKQIARWGDESQSLERRVEELAQQMFLAEAELQAALDRRAVAEEAVLEQQRLLDEARESVRALEERVQSARDERDGVRSELEGLRVDRAGARQEAEHLMVSYREAFGKLIPGTKPPDEPPASEEEEGDGEEGDESSDDEGPGAEIVPFPGSERPGDADRDEADAEEGADDDEDATAADDDEVPRVWVEDEVELPAEITSGELTRLESELARTKAALERLGPVNVLAAEEYEEQEERRVFLRKQRKDVVRSVESLRETIAEINQLSSERFKATFDEVNRVFGETFQRLFRGGEAHMSLFDEEDILETGIEITARPPGKRPQNISLLSGGEKALTAIALLFALFQSKPSPFCILDEVDAPLDDANVLRFVETLEELAQQTQFLVVTHNKLTMEVAATLYGVTMQEKGVSKLVQAEMGRLHPRLEAEAIPA